MDALAVPIANRTLSDTVFPLATVMCLAQEKHCAFTGKIRIFPIACYPRPPGVVENYEKDNTAGADTETET